MKYRALGRTGLSVSEVGFGAWGIGGRTVANTSYGDTDDAVSIAALRRAHDLGITLFDTSAAYGSGHSEELLGEAFVGRRDRVVLATKAGYEAWDRRPDFSAAAIVGSVEASLRRLRTDRIDVLMLHNAPLEVLGTPDVQEAMAALVGSGKVRCWGLSAKSPADALAALAEHDLAVIQANFNMMDLRALTGGLFAESARRGVGFIARTPLCFGFLSGTITRETTYPEGDHRLGWPRAQLENWIDGASDLLAAVEARAGLEAVHAAIRYCLSFAEVSCTIPGILTPEQAEENAAASDLGPLAPALLERVAEINRNRQFFVARAAAS